MTQAATPVAKTPPGARVKLQCSNGRIPPVPSVIITDSGRRYDCIGARGRTLHCIVMPPGADITDEDGPVIHWKWDARTKRVEP